MAQKYQKVCLNGHQLSVTSISPSDPDEFCSKCGLQVISTCQNCHAPIPGWYENEEIMYIGKRTASLPSYCSKCGKPHPWIQTILDNAAELIALDTELSEPEKIAIKASIPDLLVETPKTPIAEAKFKIYFAKMGQVVKTGMYNLIVDVISESVKKSIFPD
ncbi:MULTISPECIES: DUF2321 domain-containing protein [Enterococcus]|uniref:DUF2321 domain-containing protein n=1 Tax=Enterococcus TaxID=1350 RepID=UPI000A35821A|nr:MULTISPECIES: DUF2321 domain-containing protein [Enterococcus]EGP5212326.1 DUF2321 domain-containing protein [Enterococcus faecium]MDN3077718.1 DUF2321 domain-containing protein [Enterococcus faecium]MDQ8231114.1 DUF2321 domain-containing protein [Enterococcus faecium]MDQ8238617.1 DUF2321 domain-containing protein [Enterococcus faecium]